MNFWAGNNRMALATAAVVITLATSAGSLYLIVDASREAERARQLVEIKSESLEAGVQKILERTVSHQSVSELERRKKLFLELSAVSFMFVDKQTIEDGYNDLFREETVEKVVERVVAETNGSVATGKLAGEFLKSSVAGKTASELVKTVRLNEVSLAEKFLRYQKRLVADGSIRLGLDALDVRLEKVNDLEADIARLGKEYSVSFPADLIELKKDEIKKQLGEPALADLENGERLVLLSGLYTVQSVDADYKLTYEHPITAYLPAALGAKIQIECLVPKERIEPKYSAEMRRVASEGTTIPMNIFGRVFQPVDRARKVWSLRVVPFAVY